MKTIYEKPVLELVRVQIETFIAASPADPSNKDDSYDLGGDDSQWPEVGPIHDDWGDGPGVSG